jgi:hypothetical protein
MIAFISSSINEQEQSTVSLLGFKLRQDGFVPKVSAYKKSDVIDNRVFHSIRKSDLFIGLVTCCGDDNRRVLTEWKHAVKHRVPAWLMIENVVDLSDDPNLMDNPHVVQFDRDDPSKAIQWIQEQINNTQFPKLTQAAWKVGGEATISMINHLSADQVTKEY